MSRLKLPLTLLVLIAATMSCAALTLKELESSYEDKCAEITVQKENALKTLRTGYLAALKRIGEKYQKAGNLDAVLLTKDEAIMIEGGKWPLPAVPGKIALEVNAPRKIYLKNYLKIEQDAAKDLVDTADTMLGILEQQTVELTKSGDIQSAQLAQQIKKDIVGDAEIASARNLMKNVRSDGSSRPVLRIRRYGDNIEVLVSYDMRGKISMDSPVRNVEEADKSIGDTSAKVLGEFVGAKGYEVDPYLLKEKTFDDENLGGIRVYHADHQFKRKYGDSSGIALSVSPNSTSIFVVLFDRIPKKSIGGSTRTTVKYYIPNTNEHVTSFKIRQQGSDANSGTAVFSEKGQWKTEISESESVSEMQELYLYLPKELPDKKADNTKETLVLGSLKIEMIKFTTFVVRRFGEHGVIEENFGLPEKQPKFTHDGQLVSPGGS